MREIEHVNSARAAPCVEARARMARERSCERDRGDRLHGSCACAVVSGDDDSTRRDPPPDVVATLSDRVEYRNVGTRVGDTVRIAQLVKGVQVYGESLDDTPTATREIPS